MLGRQNIPKTAFNIVFDKNHDLSHKPSSISLSSSPRMDDDIIPRTPLRSDDGLVNPNITPPPATTLNHSSNISSVGGRSLVQFLPLHRGARVQHLRGDVMQQV